MIEHRNEHDDLHAGFQADYDEAIDALGHLSVDENREVRDLICTLN